MYEFFVAKRYLRSKRKIAFLTLIPYISVGAVAIGVAALIVALSLMNGFAGEIRDRIVGMDAHLRILKWHEEGIQEYPNLVDELEKMPHVIAASPTVYGKALIISGRSTDGIMVKGADEEGFGKVSDLQQHLIYGHLKLGEIPGKGCPGIVMGSPLADRLGVTLGDTVYLASPRSFTLSAAWSQPRLWRFLVTGVFGTGYFDFDTSLAIISVSSAQRLFGLDGAVTSIEIKLDDMYQAEPVMTSMEERLSYPYRILSWMDINRHLFNWMAIEKLVAFLGLGLIVVVAASNIVSARLLRLLERTKEIGILKAMGATRRSILRIFAIEGSVVGVVGTALGCLIGYVLCWVQDRFKLVSLPGDIYIINAVPVDMHALDFLAIGLSTLFICFAASLYPAWKAASLDPVDAIRYE